jgi:hypothetical protein
VVSCAVSVDRLVFTKSITDPEHYQALLGIMWAFKDAEGCELWKRKYTTHAKIMLETKAKVSMTAGYAHKKKFVNVDIQPHGLSTPQREELNGFLGYLFPDGGFQWLRKHANVSYIELAADFAKIDIGSLLPFHAYAHQSTRLPQYPTSLETVYLGAKRSKRSICCYDRALWLQKNKGHIVPYAVTRIEARLRKTGIPLVDIPSLDNPFTPIGVCRLHDALGVSKSKAWQAFIELAVTEGAQVAFWAAGKYKAQFLATLQSVQCDWWNPNAVWKDAKRSIERLADF